MDKKRVLYNLSAPVLGLALFIGIWYALARAVGVSLFLPTPVETLVRFFALLGEKKFYVAVGNTLLRTLLSFTAAFLLACLFAVLSAKFSFFRKAFSPFTVVLRVLPTISVILLVFLLVRSRFASYVVIFLVIFPMQYKLVLDAIGGVDPLLKEMTEAYRFSWQKKVFSFYIPQMTPTLLTGMSITLSFTVKLCVAAEVLSYVSKSMGRYMQQAYASLETETLLAWTIAAILLGFLLEGLLLLLKKVIVRRYHGK